MLPVYDETFKLYLYSEIKFRYFGALILWVSIGTIQIAVFFQRNKKVKVNQKLKRALKSRFFPKSKINVL